MVRIPKQESLKIKPGDALDAIDYCLVRTCCVVTTITGGYPVSINFNMYPSCASNIFWTGTFPSIATVYGNIGLTNIECEIATCPIIATITRLGIF
jgi:hypothetical protein